MRILLVHNRYKSNNVGGEDVVFDNELKLLRKKLGDKNVYLYQVSNDDINKFKLMFSIFFSFGHYRNIRRIIADNGVDLVHVHNIFPLLTGSVLKAAKDAGAKVVLTLHNYRLWCISGVFYRSICGACEQCAHSIFSVAGIKNRCYRNSFFQSIAAQSALWFYWKSGLFDCVNYFFILTEFQKAKVVSLGVDKKKVILKPNGVDINNINNINNLNNYIYVGRLDESKGIVDLLECWLELDDKFCLTVIGEGPMKLDLIKRYSQTNIVFMGLMSREKTLQMIAKSKYLIHPSKLYETFGLTMLEAMGCGVPVIGFNIGTRNDFIEEKVNGFLCSIEDLKKTIIMSSNYSKYNALSESALLTAMKYNNKDVLLKQVEIYQKIINES